LHKRARGNRGGGPPRLNGRRPDHAAIPAARRTRKRAARPQSLATRQLDPDGPATVAELLIAALHDDRPDVRRDAHGMEVARERLFALVVVQQLSLGQNVAGGRDDAKAVGVASRGVVGRGNRDIEVERVRSRRADLDGDDVGMALFPRVLSDGDGRR